MESILKPLKKRLVEIWRSPERLFPLLGFAFVSLLGTLLHFLPDLLTNNFIYLLCPTNESVWEHLKLLFYPYFIFMAVEYFAYGKYAVGFLGAKARGVLLGEALIVCVHYIVSGVVGRDVMWLDVTLFFIGAAVAYFLPYLMLKRGVARRYSNVSAAAIFILQILLFSVFTFYPPEIGLFFDIESGVYGIS